MDAGLFQQIYNALVPIALHGPLLTDQSGLPRYWSTIWSAVSSGQLAASTHTKKLRYIEDLYAHADRLLGKHALDDALASLNETALAEIVESWFVSLRNCPKHLECFSGCRHLSATNLPESRDHLIRLESKLKDALETIRSRTSSGIGLKNQIAHAEQRLAGVRKVLAADKGERPFPNGPDMSMPPRQ